MAVGQFLNVQEGSATIPASWILSSLYKKQVCSCPDVQAAVFSVRFLRQPGQPYHCSHCHRGNIHVSICTAVSQEVLLRENHPLVLKLSIGASLGIFSMSVTVKTASCGITVPPQAEGDHSSEFLRIFLTSVSSYLGSQCSMPWTG